MNVENIRTRLKELYYEVEDYDENSLILIQEPFSQNEDVIIEILNDKCDIYVDITEDYNHPMTEYNNGIYRLAYIEYVAKKSPILPQIQSCAKFGFFDIELQEDTVLKTLQYFGIDRDLELDHIDLEFIKSNYGEVYQTFKMYEQLYVQTFICNLSDKWIHASKNENLVKQCKITIDDVIYINRDMTMICGIGELAIRKIDKIINIPQKYVYDMYRGAEYLFAKCENRTIAINMKCINEIETIIDEASIEQYAGINYMYNGDNAFLISSDNFWSIFLDITFDTESKLLAERNSMLYRLSNLKQFIPAGRESVIYDFTSITYKQFEQLCHDILIAMGFKNVRMRGEVNAPDGGVDIEAYEEYQTVMRVERRFWIFQCKHTKSQIDRKDVSELDDLVKEFRADKFGIFYSGIFTPQTLDRIKKKEYLETWDINLIQDLLIRHPEVSKKYFGI